MKKNSTLLFILLMVTQFNFGQTGAIKVISAKVVADSSSVEKINVLNVSNEKTTITDKKGGFKMAVQIGDILVLSAVNLETIRKTVSAEDLKSEVVFFKMNPKINHLKEVNVNENAGINAENLRIVPYGQKHYTPAERKLYTASTGLLDPLLNKISGRTKMLKKEVQVERNEKLLVKFDGLYEDKYYTETLRVPFDYIKGFQYFLIEDDDFVNALVAKNKTMMQFLLKKLASDYVSTIK